MNFDFLPPCVTCGHSHFQGVKCATCGHVGKSTIFDKMKVKAAGWRQFRVEAFDVAAVVESEPLQYIIESIRHSELMEVDNVSRHVLAFVGDLPVGSARWRYEPSSSGDGTNCAFIEELVVVEVKIVIY